MHLPWWGLLCIIVGSAIAMLLFLYIGKQSLALPTCYSAAAVVLALAMRWQQTRYAWFWITMIIMASLHVPLILFVHWTTRWVPAFVIAPIAMADLYVMLAILSFVGNFMKGPKASERRSSPI